MQNIDLSSWRINRIEDVVYIPSNADYGVVGPEGIRIKQFANRRWHGLVLRTHGVSRYVYDECFLLSTPGTLDYLPQGKPYRVEYLEVGSCYCVNFSLEDSGTYEPFSLTLRNFEKVVKEYSEMARNWTYRHPGHQHRLNARLYDLFATIEEDRSAGYIPHRQTVKLREQVARLESDLRTPLSVSELAAECGMCETSFRRIFRELYGVSPKQYILQARFRQARALLSNTDASVADVAEMCGFDNIYHFSRAFRTHEGVSPTDYRRLQTTEKSHG